MDIRQLLEDRSRAITRAREIHDAASSDGNRALTAEEQTNYAAAMAERQQLTDQINRQQELDTLEAEERTSAGRVPDPETPETRTPETTDETEVRRLADVDRRFDQFLRSGREGSQAEYRGGVHGEYVGGELRALQADIDTAGGFTVVPQQFIAQLIADIDNEVFIRGMSTVRTLTRAESLGVPTRETDIEDPTWTSEIGSADEDTALAYGKRELEPHPLAKLIKISNTLLRKSAISMTDEVRTRMAYKFGTTLENVYLNGTGVEQPLGVFTASSDGISTGRDVSTGNEETYPTFDGLKTAKYTLRRAYRRRATWIFHRDGVSKLAILKDGEGRYIWQDSVVLNEPDRLLALPVRDSEYAPNTFTTGLYVGILGDFSFYWIVDALSLQIQRLVELYARTNQTGFIGRQETDGMPVQENAFVRVTLA